MKTSSGDATPVGCLTSRVAIVTGASSGLGREFVLALAREGAHVVAAARRLERIESVAEGEPRIAAFGCDVTDESQCEALVRATFERHGRIDILVNNAGISNIIPAEDETPTDFRRILEVNLVGPFTLAHFVAPIMLQQGSGSIINVSSIVGMVGLGRMPQASYSASKGGLTNLTRELAAQWARRGIRVNALAPGWFPTEMTEELFDNENGRAWVRRLTPMGRGGVPSELAGALIYLASDASSYTTGTVLPVDGGWTAV
jgi:NAD(P)-dependent dehydrogenase (short-subunit alcohol dehydrogenase family)